MPFGLINAPSIFQCMMDRCLYGSTYIHNVGNKSERRDISVAEEEENKKNLNRMPKKAYIDDLTYGGTTWDDMCERTDWLFGNLFRLNISVSILKSVFGVTSIEHLSHKITADGRSPAMKDYKEWIKRTFPKTRKQMLSFLGSVIYYKSYVQKFPGLAAILYQLKDEDFKGALVLERKAFEMLKIDLNELPMLHHPRIHDEFYVYLYANEWSVAATVYQLQENKRVVPLDEIDKDQGNNPTLPQVSERSRGNNVQVVCHTGRVLKKEEISYQHVEKEILALLHVFKDKFYLLYGKNVHVKSTRSTMRWLLKNKQLKGRQLHWRCQLAVWRFDIEKVDLKEFGQTYNIANQFLTADQLDQDLGQFEEVIKKRKLAKIIVTPANLVWSTVKYVISFDGSANSRNGTAGYAYALWEYPEWKLLHLYGANCELGTTTVNGAEYTGLTEGVKYALSQDIKSLLILGDSDLVISQLQGLKNIKTETLRPYYNAARKACDQLDYIQLYHIPRRYNTTTDMIAGEARKLDRIVDSEDKEMIETAEIKNMLPEWEAEIKRPDEDEADNNPKMICAATTRAKTNLDKKKQIRFEEELERMEDEQGYLSESEEEEVSEEPSKILQIGDKSPREQSCSHGKDKSPREQSCSHGKDKSPREQSCSHGKDKSPREQSCSPGKDKSPREQSCSHGKDKSSKEQSCSLGKEKIVKPRERPPKRNLPREYVAPVKDGGLDKDAPTELEKGHIPMLENNIQVEATTRQKQQLVRLLRIGVQQDQVPWMIEMKNFLNGKEDNLTRADYKRISKKMDMFIVDSNNILYCVSVNNVRKCKPKNISLKLVIPDLLREEFIHAMHDERSSGHLGVTKTFNRLRRRFYWPGMYKDVEKYVASCLDCQTGKGKPRNRAKSKGNILATYPLEVVGMDILGPFTITERGNAYVIVFVCQFTGFVMTAAMKHKETTAVDCALKYEEAVYDRFGACKILRHDRDPRFMSEFFKNFNASIGQKQRATLSYRPQANGTSERNIQSITRILKMFCMDPAQLDWDLKLRMVTFALNTSFNESRQETAFYLMHGFDPLTPLEAMTTQYVTGGTVKSGVQWRREKQEQWCQVREWVIEKLKKLQGKRIAKSEKMARGKPFQVGDSVWIYVPKVKEGFNRKLSHLWHGPFRIVEKYPDQEQVYKVDFGSQSKSRMFSKVHYDRMKKCFGREMRPSHKLNDTSLKQFDFDEALLPEDSWAPDEIEFGEVEEILDHREKTLKSGQRKVDYQIKWASTKEVEWLPAKDLNCGYLLQEYWEQRKAESRREALQLLDVDLL